MPKSKRSRVVTLGDYTAEKKLRKNKEDVVADLRQCLREYSNVFVLSVDNVRNNFLQDLRVRFRGSRFFFGKNAVMQVAIGRDESTEQFPGMHKFAETIHGKCCLFFTNEKKEFILEFFKDYAVLDYARSGFVPTETIVLPRGTIDMPFSLEPRLRQLGLPTLLSEGVINLLADYKVCEAGIPLSPESARLLKLLDRKMSQFRAQPTSFWGPDGEFEEFPPSE